MESLKKDFLEILSNYQGIIHKICLVYFRTETDRQDNFQEVVYQLWRSFPKLEDKRKIGSWMYNIAINTSISKIRTDSHFIAQESFPDSQQGLDPHKGMDKKEDMEILLEAIHRLNDLDKSLMLLYLEERSYEEIAEILGISKSNVGTRINRAKNELKIQLNRLSHGR